MVSAQRRELESEPLLAACRGLVPGEQFLRGRRSLGQLRLQQELRQRLVLAELLIEAAAFRQESRGGHYRTDAPSPQPFWRCHTVQRRHQPARTTPVGSTAGAGNGS